MPTEGCARSLTPFRFSVSSNAILLITPTFYALANSPYTNAEAEVLTKQLIKMQSTADKRMGMDTRHFVGTFVSVDTRTHQGGRHFWSCLSNQQPRAILPTTRKPLANHPSERYVAVRYDLRPTQFRALGFLCKN